MTAKNCFLPLAKLNLPDITLARFKTTIQLLLNISSFPNVGMVSLHFAKILQLFISRQLFYENCLSKYWTLKREKGSSTLSDFRFTQAPHTYIRTK